MKEGDEGGAVTYESHSDGGESWSGGGVRIGSAHDGEPWEIRGASSPAALRFPTA